MPDDTRENESPRTSHAHFRAGGKTCIRMQVQERLSAATKENDTNKCRFFFCRLRPLALFASSYIYIYVARVARDGRRKKIIETRFAQARSGPVCIIANVTLYLAMQLSLLSSKSDECDLRICVTDDYALSKN